MKLLIETGNENPILRARSTEIRPEEFVKFRTLSEAMVKYVKDERNGSVGVAAPQVGTNRRLIAVSLLAHYDDENFRTIAMLNPEILEASDVFETDSEGCLSVPGKRGEVSRPKRVRIRYSDIRGKHYILDLVGLSARIVQHEIDHLNGILFTDKVSAGTLLEKIPQSEMA